MPVKWVMTMRHKIDAEAIEEWAKGSPNPLERGIVFNMFFTGDRSLPEGA